MSKGFITLSQIQSYKIIVKLYIHLAKVTKKISKVNIEQITSEVKKLTIHYQRQLTALILKKVIHDNCQRW